MSRTIAWVSHAASVIAARFIPEAELVLCDMGDSEDADNRRFIEEVAEWLDRPLVRLTGKYRNIDEVFEARKYHAGIAGAPCTGEMKVAPRLDYQLPSDTHVFGYTADWRDMKRAEHFRATYPDLKVRFPLIERGLTKEACFSLVEAAGIRRPRVYDLGFPNGNCIGCVKATSPDYWSLVRKHFPEVFARRAEQSRRFGSRLARINDERIFIDEIPADWPTMHPSVPACDFLCQIAEQDMKDAA